MRAVPGAVIVGDEDVDISGVEYHSRMIQPNALFVAITGFQHDGNDYVDEAINRGAAAVVTEKQTTRPVPQVIVPDARAALADLAAAFYGYDGAAMDVFGITGTNGKTTSCFLLRRILEAHGRRTGLVTSLVYDTGRDQIPAARTTPESLDIYRMLYLMRKNECTAAVIEISSHALALHRVRNLNVRVAVFTNITRDHLDFHADMDEYLNTKARLLDMVDDPSKRAVINYDCPEFRPFLSRGNASKLTYSVADDSADVHLRNCRLSPRGSRFELVSPVGSREMTIKLTGRFNLYNTLAASAAASAADIDLDTIAAGLEQAEVIPGRLERIAMEAPFSIFVDYAHTPDALTRTIEALKEIGGDRVLVLFGCGGDRDRGKRPMMGRAVTSAADYTVLTSDNPRTEDPARILDDVKPGFAAGAEVEVIADRREAIAHILGRAGAGDIVLLAGKGAEDYQEINGVRYPFSDREVAVQCLRDLGYGE